MSNAITWDSEALEREMNKTFVSLKRIARLVIIALGLVLGAWLLGLLARALTSGELARRVGTVTQWVLFLAGTGACVGTVILLKALSRFATWQNEIQNEWSERLNSAEKLWSTTSMGLRSQIAEGRQAEERLQKQNGELAERSAALQAELDKRKMAE